MPLSHSKCCLRYYFRMQASSLLHGICNRRLLQTATTEDQAMEASRHSTLKPYKPEDTREAPTYPHYDYGLELVASLRQLLKKPTPGIFPIIGENCCTLNEVSTQLENAVTRAQYDLRKWQARSQDMTERLDEMGDHIYKTWHTGDRELPIRVEDVSDMEVDYAEAHETYSQLHKRVEGVNKECEVRYRLLAKLKGEFEDLHGKYEDVLGEVAVWVESKGDDEDDEDGGVRLESDDEKKVEFKLVVEECL